MIPVVKPTPANFMPLLLMRGNMADVSVKKSNPYHDAEGEFTSKEKAVSPRSTAEAPSINRPLRSRIIPTAENSEHRSKMAKYMAGFYSALKNENERKYVEERSRQMINGEVRPKGMSSKFGLSKSRAIQYEALTYKIFQAGRNKIGV